MWYSPLQVLRTVFPFRPFLLSPARVFSRPFDFAGPLFSYSYELLLPQPLCFDIHPHCPGCHPPACPKTAPPLCLCGKSPLFSNLRTLCRSQKSQLLCNQANPASFCKTPGVGYPEHNYGTSGVAYPFGSSSVAPNRKNASL